MITIHMNFDYRTYYKLLYTYDQLGSPGFLSRGLLEMLESKRGEEEEEAPSEGISREGLDSGLPL